MNKTLIALGVGIWGIMLFLSFVFNSSLAGADLSCEAIRGILFPLMLIEIVAFFIALAGIFKD